MLYKLFIHDCVASQNNTSIIKFADGFGLITGGAENAHSREVAEPVTWCHDNNLSLNVDKTKEMIIDPRRTEMHISLYNGET